MKMPKIPAPIKIISRKDLSEVLAMDLSKIIDEPPNLTGMQALADFAVKTKGGGTWVYVYHGTLTQAKAFVRIIRTNLARAREQARDQGRPLDHFKTRATYRELDDRQVEISLWRSESDVEAQKAVARVFDSITLDEELLQEDF